MATRHPNIEVKVSLITEFFQFDAFPRLYYDRNQQYLPAPPEELSSNRDKGGASYDSPIISVSCQVR
jgi:hypothetical protein